MTATVLQLPITPRTREMWRFPPALSGLLEELYTQSGTHISRLEWFDTFMADQLGMLGRRRCTKFDYDSYLRLKEAWQLAHEQLEEFRAQRRPNRREAKLLRALTTAGLDLPKKTWSPDM